MRHLLLSLLIAFAPTTAFASQCDKFFPNGKEITVPGTTVLCNTFYATVYNANKEEAIFSTEAFVPHADKIERSNDFHADARLGKNSPTPSDYDNTGYDRGHLVPAADAGTDAQMSDTFLMTNMTPQEPTVNRNSWRLLEASVRNMPATYIVTGAVYTGSTKVIGKHSVPVPTSYYKVVYLKDGTVKAYTAANTVKAPVQEVPLATVESMSGIKLH